MIRTQTINNALAFLNEIKAIADNGENISAGRIKKMAKDNNTSKNYFYNMLYSGVIVKNKMGIYEFPPIVQPVFVRRAIEEQKMRYKTPAKKSNNIPNETDAIAFLKGLGYKIMKPVTEFQEL